MTNTIDGRKYPRYKDVTFLVAVSKNRTYFQKVMVIDISASGVKFYFSDDKINVGENLFIKIHIGSTYHNYNEIFKCTVVRKETRKDPKKISNMVYSVEYIDIHSYEKDYFDHILTSLLQ